MDIINHTNYQNIDLNSYLHYKIFTVNSSTRRGSGKLYEGKPNCSGFNIWKLVENGITVNQYQNIIRNNFSKDDPQFSLTKHLLWDLEKGFLQLRA